MVEEELDGESFEAAFATWKKDDVASEGLFKSAAARIRRF